MCWIYQKHNFLKNQASMLEKDLLYTYT
jgi:hypothetical protein